MYTTTRCKSDKNYGFQPTIVPFDCDQYNW